MFLNPIVTFRVSTKPGEEKARKLSSNAQVFIVSHVDDILGYCMTEHRVVCGLYFSIDRLNIAKKKITHRPLNIEIEADE
jgi:hypothetical protein